MTASERRQIMKSSPLKRDDSGRIVSGNVSRLKRQSFDLDLVGKRFGCLTVLSAEVIRKGKNGESYIQVRCDCGQEYPVYYLNMVSGKSTRCSKCKGLESRKPYPKWLAQRIMAQRSRCQNPKDQGYKNYGARGIEFRFKSTEEAAMWVMGNLGLHPELTLDRINNNGHYEKGNLRYVTQKVQTQNMRTSVLKCDFNPLEWPYSLNVVRRKIAAGLTRAQIFEDAWTAVTEKRKNWRGILAKLESMTC